MIENLPRSTGVYLMKNAHGGIIYVGKAFDLRSRVKTYLGHDNRPYTEHIRKNTEQVEVLLTSNEKEALLLENQLIKAHKPRYNISLKDDKSYIRLKITTGHQWPGMYLTRKIIKDGSRYFGPYSSVQATKKTLSAIGRIFPIRRCKDSVFNNRVRPCIYYQIGLCKAPCVSKVSPEEYDQTLNDLISFLEGRNRGLIAELDERMKIHADLLEFEKAARIRDQINAIKTTLVPQVIVGDAKTDTDIIGTYRFHDQAQVTVLHILKGTIVDTHSFFLKDIGEKNFITSFILQFYLGRPEIPPNIYCDIVPDDQSLLEAILSDMRKAKVKIVHATRGKPRQWINIAQESARNHFKGGEVSILEDIARALRLPAIPYHMECYDISSLGGQYATASRAVFIDGNPDKSLYRHYRIQDVSTQDDFAMLAEVLGRRLRGDDPRPDLLVIDGGKGQLGICLKVLKELGLSSIPVVAMAKQRGSKTDRFFLPGRKDAIKMHPRSGSLKTLQLLRDEAHRFAVKYHRHLRSSSVKNSVFEQIPGIGSKKAAAILSYLGDQTGSGNITEDVLAGCKTLSKRDRANIVSFFKDH